MMTILAFLLAILILVGFHEFGHYITAKFCGIIVERFSIGFGPVLWKKTPKNPFDTEFVLSAIPLGGYVKLLDSKEYSSLVSKLSRFNFSHTGRQIISEFIKVFEEI